MSWWKKKKKVILFFYDYNPLQIRTLKICNHDISKSITAMSFKLGQLIEDDKEINWWKLKKIYFIFFELSPFADLDFENLYSWYLKNYNS